MLFKQFPNGSFEDVTIQSGLLTGKDFMGAFGGVATGDINNDGYLDLIIVMWEGDLTLYLNNGDGTFSDISTSIRRLHGVHRIRVEQPPRRRQPPPRGDLP